MYSIIIQEQGARFIETAIVFNPKAGKLRRNGHLFLNDAQAILRKAGHRTRLLPTTGPKMAGNLARQAIAEGAELILAAGGDGTVNEIAEGMIGSRVPLGILPAGTANVLATEMGLGSRMIRAAESLGRAVPTRISVGRLQSSEGTRHFLLMAGIGLDARVVYNVSAPLKQKAGKVAYWVAGFSLVGRRLEEFEIEIEGRKRLCSFALVSKVRNYGGDFQIARDTSLLDDRFEVVLFEGPSSFRYLKYLAGMILNRLNGMSGVSVLRARDVAFPEPKDCRIYVQTDGEYAGRLPAKIGILEDALTLLIPPEYLRTTEAQRRRDSARTPL